MMGIIYLFFSGLFNSIMVSFNGQLGNYHSLFAVTFWVHAIAAVILFIGAGVTVGMNPFNLSNT